MAELDPAMLLALGEQLSKDASYTDNAAKTRTALGRAYYSLMLALRKAIRQAEGKSIDREIARHGDLWNTLIDSKVQPLQALGKSLQQLYKARRKADYELDPPQFDWSKNLADPRFALKYVEIAKDAIRRIPRCDFAPVRGKL